MSDFDFRQFDPGPATGLDAFLASEPQIISAVGEAPQPKPRQRVRVGSLQQLANFRRVAADTLINKSTQDLWAIQKDGDDFFIERLFQDDGQPLKG